MNKKKWAFLILCILLVAGYIRFFNKAYSESAVAASADCIIALDVKRVTNTAIWNMITSPSQWKRPSFSSSDKISWKDMVKMPDFVFAFHAVNQPSNAWYVMLKRKGYKDFNKGLQVYGFEKVNSQPGFQEYISKKFSIHIIQQGDKLLVGNAMVEDKHYMRQIAEELFVEKKYITKEALKRNINARSHLSMQIKKNNFLMENAVIKANFSKTKIVIESLITPKNDFSFSENKFSYNDSSLCTLVFTQPPAWLYSLLPDSAKMNISKAVNFNIDSLLLQNNYAYSLDMAKIQPRIDSAISYSYDNNFNPVEKVVVNNIMEPSFNFTVKGENVANIYSYWNNNGKLETTSAGQLFIPVPFVKSYCRIKNEKELSIVSGNYQSATGQFINCIFFFNFLPHKIPGELQKYFPAPVLKTMSKIISIQMHAKKSNGKIFVQARFNKRKNDLDVINW